MKENNMINYSEEEKNIEWKYKDYSFHLPETLEQILEIDCALQISANRARMDLILSKQIVPVYVKKEDVYKILILLKKSDNTFLLDFCCGEQKTIPDQKELNMINIWCEEKQIILSNGVRL